MQISSNLTVNDIVVDAFDFIRIGTEFKNLTGRDEERGVKLVNEILSSFNAAGSKLPFFYTTEFSLESGKKKYLIGSGPSADVSSPYFVDVDFVNIINEGIRYNVKVISDMQALSTATELTSSFLPGWARVYRENDDLGNTYTVIDFLYSPDQVYTCEVRGKPKIEDIGITDDITYLPRYYRTYLKLELARRLVPYYGQESAWTPMTEKMYNEAKDLIEASVQKNLEVVPSDALLFRNGAMFGSTLGVRR